MDQILETARKRLSREPAKNRGNDQKYKYISIMNIYLILREKNFICGQIAVAEIVSLLQDVSTHKFVFFISQIAWIRDWSRTARPPV